MVVSALKIIRWLYVATKYSVFTTCCGSLDEKWKDHRDLDIRWKTKYIFWSSSCPSVVSSLDDKCQHSSTLRYFLQWAHFLPPCFFNFTFISSSTSLKIDRNDFLFQKYSYYPFYSHIRCSWTNAAWGTIILSMDRASWNMSLHIYERIKFYMFSFPFEAVFTSQIISYHLKISWAKSGVSLDQAHIPSITRLIKSNGNISTGDNRNAVTSYWPVRQRQEI